MDIRTGLADEYLRHIETSLARSPHLRYHFDVTHGAHYVAPPNPQGITMVAPSSSPDTGSGGAAPNQVLVIRKIWPLAGAAAGATRLAGGIAGKLGQSKLGQAVQGGYTAVQQSVGNTADKLAEGFQQGKKAALQNPPVAQKQSMVQGTLDVTGGGNPVGDTVIPDSTSAPQPQKVSSAQPSKVDLTAQGQTTMDDFNPATHGDVDTKVQQAAGQQKRRDTTQNILGAGYIGVTGLQQRGATKRGQMEAERERLMNEASTEQAGTGGGQVAVAKSFNPFSQTRRCPQCKQLTLIGKWPPRCIDQTCQYRGEMGVET